MREINERVTYYVTTPIYYVTAKPHLGSLYSTLMADVLARWNRLQGKKVFFLTGTDEHGQKIAQAAQEAGKAPKEFVDGFIQSYQDAWHTYAIEYTHFIRTTDDYHVHAVQQWLEKLLKSGDIYKSFYRGWYCVPDETFVTFKDGLVPQNSERSPACPSCGRATQWVQEETYNFKLSAYQNRLLQFYREHPDFIIPLERAQEVINFVASGLKDLSISRTTITWGIPFPNDTAHVTYVWADALNNYITAIGYLQAGREQEFAQWWPADVQILGKDIVRFHAVYWPAFLMASNLALPKHLLVHGWIKVNQQKMSKSLGNVVDPLALCAAYGADQVRYYLMRYMAITHDSDFSTQDLERSINSDLANDLGNLLNRVAGLADKNNLTLIQVPTAWPDECNKLQELCRLMVDEVIVAMENCMFHMALAAVWKYINRVNAFVHENQPWKLAKTDPDRLCAQLSAACHSLQVIATLLWPIMPQKMNELYTALGLQWHSDTRNLISSLSVCWQTNFTLSVKAPLFMKIEAHESIVDVEKKVSQIAEQASISIDDFCKVVLLVGLIKECSVVPKSDKLLCLQVDFGSYGMRQVLSGIRAYYKPEQLINCKAVFVFNLAPRAMMGMESQGMILTAARADGTVSLVSVEETVPAGTRLK